MVQPMGHFSDWDGSLALFILVLAVVVRTTEDMLLLVPESLREAASALGAPRWMVIQKICYRAARACLITGTQLAIARISGETAPLLFTSLHNQFWRSEAHTYELPYLMLLSYAVFCFRKKRK